MKVKIFIGRWVDVQKAFNKWAKGKTLNSQVIIHELLIKEEDEHEDAEIAIVVYHPSTERWDKSG